MASVKETVRLCGRDYLKIGSIAGFLTILLTLVTIHFSVTNELKKEILTEVKAEIVAQENLNLLNPSWKASFDEMKADIKYVVNNQIMINSKLDSIKIEMNHMTRYGH